MIQRRLFLSALAAASLIVAPFSLSAEEAKPAAPAAAAAAPVKDGPKIAFESTTLNLGDVVKGENAVFTFKFKNEGTADLEISQAKPSCGCTVAEFTRLVKPGESGTVAASVDTKRFKGEITKTVTVTCNDPNNGTVHLSAKANVKAIIDVSPSEQVYFRVFRGDETPSKRVLTITSEAGQPFEIKKVDSSNPAVTTNLINLATSADPKLKELATGTGGSYQVEVDVKRDAPIGPLVGVVTLTTSNKDVPTITLNINGQVLGDVIVTPQKVYLGQVTTATAPSIKRTVRIERRQGTDFKIVKVESSNPSLKAEMAPVEDGKVYQLTISLTGELAAGDVNANVVVTTNDKEQATIEIPVIGSVKG